MDHIGIDVHKKDSQIYQGPGVDCYDRRHAQRVTRRAVATLERQGYRVTIERVA
jgi:hypothetical protein